MNGNADYSRSQLIRMARIPNRRLRDWQRLGLFSAGPRFGWQDLLRARRLRQCGEAHIPPARLRDLLDRVRARCQELGTEPLDASLDWSGGRLAVRLGALTMEAISGQLRLPFPAPATVLAAVPGAAQPAATGEAEYWFAQGLALEGAADQREAAAAAYLRCLELDPGFGSALINLGTVRYHQKNFVAAERAYRQALKLDSDYALAHFNLGNVLDETGRLEEAIAAYGDAVRLAPAYADAHYNLALALQRQGQHRRAIPHWRQYLGVDRASPWANHARDQLKRTLERDVLQLVPGA